MLAAVRAHFKPEFLNRLDDIVVFDALSPADLRAIVDIQLERLARRLADRRLALEVTDAARDWLASTGTTRCTAPARCGAWSSPRSATSWPRRCWPARSATATASSSTWRTTRRRSLSRAGHQGREARDAVEEERCVR